MWCKEKKRLRAHNVNKFLRGSVTELPSLYFFHQTLLKLPIIELQLYLQAIQRDPKPFSKTCDRIESTEFFGSLKCQEKYTKKSFTEIGHLIWFRWG